MLWKKAAKSILVVELIGFLIVVIAVWLDVLFDLPHRLFGDPELPRNFVESFFESVFILGLGIAIALITRRLMRRISQLEEILPICSFCKKIRKPDSDPEEQRSWQEVERYINERAGSQFSHGLCPECAEKHYGKYLKDK